MAVVTATSLPGNSLLRRYADGADAGAGHYTDCFSADVEGDVSLTEFVTAFYTTPLFRIERIILRWLARRPSSDADVTALASARADAFAAWTVERRERTQLLMADVSGRTRSWFMVDPAPRCGAATRLFFGSAVLRDRAAPTMPVHGFGFRTVIRFHRGYSVALLWSARRRLHRQRHAR